MSTSNTEQLLTEYKRAVAGAAMYATVDPEKNNACSNTITTCYEQLRQTEEGRAGIIALMSDDNPYVRAAASTHSLQWAPDIARSVLEDIRDGDGPGSFEAKWTLREFDEGNLDFS